MNLITILGKQKLEEKIAALQEELRRTYEQRQEAAAEGDLKENSAYIFMGERAVVLNTQIDEAKTDLKLSQVASAPAQTDTIVFGSLVTVRFNSDGREITFTLVGKNDAHLKPGWISLESPLGQAVLNHHVNDQVMVNGQSVTISKIAVGEI